MLKNYKSIDCQGVFWWLHAFDMWGKLYTVFGCVVFVIRCLLFFV